MTSLGGISDAALFFGRWGIVAAVVLGLGARTLVEEEYLFKPEKAAEPRRTPRLGLR
jgi:predicted secreted protein